MRRVVALGVLVAIACGACAAEPPRPDPATPSGATPTSGGSLRVALTGAIAALDPWNVVDADSLRVTRQLYETLVGYEPGGLRIVPMLATSWSVSADGRQWRFSLRHGVKFHDGTDLNAEAVVFNFERARSRLDPYRGPPIGDHFGSFAAVWGGFDDDAITTKIEAPDAFTVVLTTRTPFGPLLADLAIPQFAIVSPASIKADVDGWMTRDSRGAAGTGPFVFQPGAWLGDGRITLERNGNYWESDAWGARLPYFDRVTFRTISDEAARVAALRAGSVDGIGDVSPAGATAIRADPNLQVLTRPPFGVVYLGLSLAVRPLDEPSVRRAIATAIDRPALARALRGGDAKVASQFLAPGMLGYDDSVTDFYRFDRAGAKKLLADGGFPTGFTTELWYPSASRLSFADPRKAAEAIAADLAAAGVTANLRTEDAAAFRLDAEGGRFPMWLSGWIGPSVDPDDFLGALFRVPTGGEAGPAPRGAWLSTPALDLLRRAQAETDPGKRTELYKQVSKLVQQDVPRIPLFNTSPPTGLTKKVRGLMPSPTGGEAFARVWLGK